MPFQPERHHVDPIPVLGDGRVRLRGVVPADVPYLLEITVYDGVAAADEAEAAAIQARIEADRKTGVGVQWGICEHGRDDIVGTCGFHHGYANGVGEIGYALRSAYRGRGLMTAAVLLIVAYGFETLGLAAIVAHTAPDNRASQAVLQRAGFRAVASEDRTLHRYRLDDAHRSRRFPR